MSEDFYECTFKAETRETTLLLEVNSRKKQEDTQTDLANRNNVINITCNTILNRV